ncbi:hypothetical protein AB0C27_15650 [Nonomuraea sp. NPDC048882]|uniref:hypothetical protein n=1 Tax=Nonomuraea sp. NPDC048882 TaxID=3154347 RepID=UPI0033C7695D
MSDAEVAREVLGTYKALQVANPIGKPPDPEKVEAARKLETKIAFRQPSDDHTLVPAVAMKWKESPEYWVTGGEIVAQNLNRPLTCILFAHLCVYALKKGAPTFTVPIEVVELKKGGFDNHYILVAGRTTGALGDKLSEWNQDAFIIDLWGHNQNRGKLVAQPPAIIVSDMEDASRKTVATIPAWGV